LDRERYRERQPQLLEGIVHHPMRVAALVGQGVRHSNEVIEREGWRHPDLLDAEHAQQVVRGKGGAVNGASARA
jgi:hypothetical protein